MIVVDPKWIRNKSDELAITEGCHFDQSYPNRVKDFIQTQCKQYLDEWAAKTYKLIPWQEDGIDRFYGWRRGKNKRWRTWSIFLGKQNGKTTLCAAIAIFELLFGPPGARVVICCPTIEQAKTMFTACLGITNQLPYPYCTIAEKGKSRKSGKLWPRPNIKCIEFAEKMAELRVTSGDKGGAKSGEPISCLLLDELSEFTNRDNIQALLHNAGKRKDGFVMTISTASTLLEGIGKEYFDYGIDIQNSIKLDTFFLPQVWAADIADDWTSLETFRKANPSFDYGLIDPEEVRQKITEAQNDSRKKSAYCCLRLNQWQTSAMAWLSYDTWRGCGGTFDPSILEKKPVYGGLDLSQSHDTTCWLMLGLVDGVYYLLPRFFLPIANIESKGKADGFDYALQEKLGNITLTPGDTVDYTFVRTVINADAKRFNIQEIGYDPYNGSILAQQMQDEDGLRMVECKPSFPNLAPATGRFEVLLKEKKIRHGDHPILNWQATICGVRPDSWGNIIPYGVRDRDRIDGISSAVTALSRAMGQETIIYTAKDLVVF